jgi:protease-4
LKTGKFKDSGAEYKPMDPESRALLQGVIDDVLVQFKEAVVEGRKISPEALDKIADGRIFSGKQALDLRLVDELGGVDAAVRAAGKLGKIEGEPKVVYPSQPHSSPWVDYFVGDEEEGEASARRIQPRAGFLSDLAQAFSLIGSPVAAPQAGPGIYWLWSQAGSVREE